MKVLVVLLEPPAVEQSLKAHEAQVRSRFQKHLRLGRLQFSPGRYGMIDCTSINNPYTCIWPGAKPSCLSARSAMTMQTNVKCISLRVEMSKA